MWNTYSELAAVEDCVDGTEAGGGGGGRGGVDEQAGISAAAWANFLQQKNAKRRDNKWDWTYSSMYWKK